MCVYSTVCILSTFTPSSVKKNHRHITRVGWEPTTFTILEQCQTNFFLTIKNKKNTQLSSFSHLYKMYKSFNHKFDTFFRLFYIHVTQSPLIQDPVRRSRIAQTLQLQLMCFDLSQAILLCAH